MKSVIFRLVKISGLFWLNSVVFNTYAPCTLDDVPSDGHAAAEEDAEGVVHLARLVSLGDESNIVPELVGGCL